jgi:hypothetical protein
MSFFRIDISLARLQAKNARAPAAFVRTLDRFVNRGALELSREEQEQAPKAFSTLVQSIAVQKNAAADYTVISMARYAAAVNQGSEPHLVPLLPLYLWLKYTKRITDEKELRSRAYALRRFIAKNGTKPNPFVSRARIRKQGRIVRLIREGVSVGIQEAYRK